MHEETLYFYHLSMREIWLAATMKSIQIINSEHLQLITHSGLNFISELVELVSQGKQWHIPIFWSDCRY